LTGPRNLRREPMAEKLARIDAIGGPDTDSNYPLGWAMASNTPLRRYKFNTHGAGYPAPAGIGTQMTTQGTICTVRNRLIAGGQSLLRTCLWSTVRPGGGGYKK